MNFVMFLKTYRKMSFSMHQTKSLSLRLKNQIYQTNGIQFRKNRTQVAKVLGGK